MTIKRERPPGGGGRLDSRCLGSSKPSQNYNQSCPACGIPTQSDHLCPVCRAWLNHYTSMESAIAAIRALDTSASVSRPALRLVRRSL
jgi:hypothetical protein